MINKDAYFINVAITDKFIILDYEITDLMTIKIDQLNPILVLE